MTRSVMPIFLRAVLVALVAQSAAAESEAPPGVPACPSGAEKPDVAALVKRTEQLLKGDSSVGTITMSIKTPAWSRKLVLKIWTRGKGLALVRVLEGGPRETGMMTLKREKQLWNWLPQAGRLMKLPSGMMGDSWMGSDFTNDDLVKGSSLIDDFDSVILGIGNDNGHEAWQVKLMPKPNAVVVWGRIDMNIDRQTCLPLTELFYDEDVRLVRQMVFSDFRRIGWRQFPAKFTVAPKEPGRETSLSYDEITFDVPVPDETFSLERLRQGR
jgi:hypothetical protein